MNPERVEVCDNLDNDCNGVVDDGACGEVVEPAPTDETGGCAQLPAVPGVWALVAAAAAARRRRRA
jgi:hypothetical protein